MIFVLKGSSVLVDISFSLQLNDEACSLSAKSNNRFLGKKSDTFKKSADKCMTDIINYMYEGLYDKVNAKAKRHLSKCVPDSKMSHIPFA